MKKNKEILTTYKEIRDMILRSQIVTTYSSYEEKLNELLTFFVCQRTEFSKEKFVKMRIMINVMEEEYEIDNAKIVDKKEFDYFLSRKKCYTDFDYNVIDLLNNKIELMEIY